MNFREYPGLLPGIAMAILIGVAVGGRLGRALGISRFLAVGLVVALGLAISATLTPGSDAIRHGTTGSGACDLGRLTLAPLSDVIRFKETGLNVVLLVPLGAAVGLMPRSRTKSLLVVGAIVLPFMIEGIQLVATPLGRACQSADVMDNLTGLVIGVVIGTVLGRVLVATGFSDSNEEGTGPA